MARAHATLDILAVLRGVDGVEELGVAVDDRNFLFLYVTSVSVLKSTYMGTGQALTGYAYLISPASSDDKEWLSKQSPYRYRRNEPIPTAPPPTITTWFAFSTLFLQVLM